MEYFWWLYFATRLDSFSEMFGWFIFLSIIAVFITTVARMVMICNTEEFKKETRNQTREEAEREFAIWMRHFKKAQHVAILAFFASCFLYTATPTKRDAMFIAGGIGVIEAAKAMQGSAIAKKSVSVVEAWLEKELEQIKTPKSKAVDAPKVEPTAEQKPSLLNDEMKKLLTDTAKEAGRIAAKEALK